jgi:hypothetical protein
MRCPDLCVAPTAFLPFFGIHPQPTRAGLTSAAPLALDLSVISNCRKAQQFEENSAAV